MALRTLATSVVFCELCLCCRKPIQLCCSLSLFRLLRRLSLFLPTQPISLTSADDSGIHFSTCFYLDLTKNQKKQANKKWLPPSRTTMYTCQMIYFPLSFKPINIRFMADRRSHTKRQRKYNTQLPNETESITALSSNDHVGE